MWLLLFIFFDILFVQWFLSGFSLLGQFFIVCGYLISLQWGSEKTGDMRLSKIRALNIWKYVSGVSERKWQEPDLILTHSKGPRLFIVAPNLTGWSMFWIFGFHGDKVLYESDVVYALPPLLFYIPILREILLMSGAIAQTESTIKNLISHRRSVAMCPYGLKGAAYKQDSTALRTNGLPKYLIQPCSIYRAMLIPCIIWGEANRFPRIRVRSKKVQQGLNIVQAICLRKLEYPFPNMYWVRFRENMALQTGDCMDIEQCPKKDDVRNKFHEHWRKVGNSMEGIHMEIIAD